MGGALVTGESAEGNGSIVMGLEGGEEGIVLSFMLRTGLVRSLSVHVLPCASSSNVNLPQRLRPVSSGYAVAPQGKPRARIDPIA